ncbi:DNA methyltransferase [Polyangium jinanense]|uniref:DNA methyltransferase n=1 Tax=Polyangium jinanense TaxID=2829994 RepID=UPI00234094E8|nr:DNA methyltransferase [Polyangium jinanense]MDC3958219.1 class I SAM-dependent DNA methyltransferase [Polyangium jinanense]
MGPVTGAPERVEETISAAERRQLGVHYTNEAFILRTIRPLFLDVLEASLAAASTAVALRAFVERLLGLRFLDPSCGAGNFLVVAYREIRRLEIEALVRLRARGTVLPRRVRLDQFCGIEIDERAANAAKIALEREAEAGELEFVGPSGVAPRITVGNALRIDWNDVLPAGRASFVFGNPPFVGMAWMSAEQQEDRRLAFEQLDTRGLHAGRLDYAAAFIARAMTYRERHPVRFAFVATNSLTQGEQARSLGPLLRRYGYRIDFAHRTFHWASDAKGKANVHVVVIGFSRGKSSPRRIFDYPDPRGEPVERAAKNINVFLADGPDVVPRKRKTPLGSGYPAGTKGSQPTDGGHLVVEPADHAAVMADPVARRYVRRYLQASEFLWDEPRHCLWLEGVRPEEIAASPVLQKRIEAVRRVRLASRTPSVRDLADKPWLFTQIRQPSFRYLALPEVSSENRRVIPAAFVDPDVIAGNKLITFPGADDWVFGMLQSSMFMAWVRAVAGRMKSDISIAPHLTYCTFPFPTPDAKGRRRVEEAAREVLAVRETFPGKSLGELYDPRRMPEELARAHDGLDRAVEGLFEGGKPFRTEADRLRALFERYATLSLAGRA